MRAIAETGDAFASIGQAGPTMNDESAVAFAQTSNPRGAACSSRMTGVTTIADTQGPWRGFDGLPLIDLRGREGFRADREDGVEGIYAWHEGTLLTVAETGRMFASLSSFPSANREGVVVFVATLRSGRQGTFTAEDGRIEAIVDVDGELSRTGAP